MASTFRSVSTAAVAALAWGTSICTTASACPCGTRCDRTERPRAKFCYVQRVFAKDGADAADDSRDVMVPDCDQGAVERGLDVDAVIAEQARRVAV